MNIRKALVAFGIGIAIGFLARKQYEHFQRITPEKALKLAKQHFKKQGPISGSWIYMKPEEVEKNGLKYMAYRGGITRPADGGNKQFEFYADAETGAIIGAVQTQ